MSATKVLSRTLASACFLGSSCCSVLLFGQQLKPATEPQLAPVVSAAEANTRPLLPMVKSANLQGTESSRNTQLAPVVPASQMNAQQAQAQSMMPPIVTPSQAAAQPSQEAPVVQYEQIERDTVMSQIPEFDQSSPGQNFPSDAHSRIAEFIRQNTEAQNQVENAALAVPEGFQFVPQDDVAQAAMMTSPAPQQDASPSDRFVPPPANVPAPAPQIGGQSVVIPPGAMTPGMNPMMNQPRRGVGSALDPNQGQSGNPAQQPFVPGQNDYFAGPGGPAGMVGPTGPVPLGPGPMPSGPDGYGQGPVGYGPINSAFDCCGFVCGARDYFIFDLLFYNRADGVFRASNLPFVDDYDFNEGGRITIGKRKDCTRGIEFSYFGFEPWLAVSSFTEPGGTLQGALFDTRGNGRLGPFAFTAFNRSTFIEQFHKTDLHSVEFNWTRWGADVAKGFIGFRGIYFNDEFRLSAANIFGTRGVYAERAENRLFGIHGGGEVLYDIGYRLSFSLASKLGVYGNSYRARTSLVNGNVLWVANGRNNTDVAYSAEVGAYARYKITRKTRLRFGYEVLGLVNVREPESSYSTVVTRFSGTNYRRGGALFHGGSIGFEIYW